MSANGQLSASELAPIPGGRLRKDAAAAWNAMLAEAKRRGLAVPMPDGPASSYRTLAQQVQEKAIWTAKGHPENAADPGHSNHGWGLAVDCGDPEQQHTIDLIGQEFGFDRGPGGWSDAPWEAWHTLFKPGVWKAPKQWPFLPLRQGKKGLWVYVLAGRLRNCGYHRDGKGEGPLLPRTSKFDAHVEHAVMRFQSQQHLAADGIVGAATWARLKAAEKSAKKARKRR